MNRKRIYILMSLMLLFVLSGCSLAKEDAGKEVLESDEIVQDRLIGVVVTDEHLDLFNMEAFLDDNLDKIADGQVLEENDSAKYQDRIYATLDKHGSDEPYKWDFHFDGIEGYIFMTPTMQDGDNGPFHMMAGEDFFSDVTTHLKVTDDGEEIELVGTLFLESGKNRNNAEYYLNPVYQTEEGEIYLTGGNGYSSNVMGEEGNEMSGSISGTHNSTINGVTESYTATVEIKFITVDPPKKIRFIHMNEKHEMIDVQEFAPEEVPEEFEAAEGTAYVLMETEKEGVEGVRREREVCEPDKEGQMTVKVFCPSEDGILIQKYVKIVF